MKTSFTFPPRLELARLPTPIEKRERLTALLGGPEIYVKRDDMTGIALSGNKVRKLEFSAARALQEGCDVLITCGGVQSNHCRATAAVAARLGLQAHLVLGGERPALPEGNFFLDQLLGAEITLVPTEDLDALMLVMQELESRYRKQGKHPLIVPMGASDATGALGYAWAVGEMAQQFDALGFTPDMIWVASGSAGTHSGLLIGMELFDLPCRVYTVNVRMDAAYFRTEMARIFAEFDQRYGYLPQAKPEEALILDGYVGAGYALSTPAELQFIASVARSEGLLLDTAYTGKALYGFAQEVKKGTFKAGEKVLFIHTGGLFGLFPSAAEFAAHVF